MCQMGSTEDQIYKNSLGSILLSRISNLFFRKTEQLKMIRWIFYLKISQSLIFIIILGSIQYRFHLPSIAKVTSSLRGVPFLINTPDVSSSISVWKGPKAFVNPSLGYQIFPLSEESSTFNDVTSFKSLKSILRSFLCWSNLLVIQFAKSWFNIFKVYGETTLPSKV